ncbi:MAG: hypothetical protein ACOC4C_05530 [Fibrobacterota bacterium]
MTLPNDELIDISFPVDALAKEGELLYDWVQDDLHMYEANVAA